MHPDKRALPLPLCHTQKPIRNQCVMVSSTSFYSVQSLLHTVSAASFAAKPAFCLGPLPAFSAWVRLLFGLILQHHSVDAAEGTPTSPSASLGAPHR